VFVLVLKFRYQLVYLGFYQSKYGVGLLDNLMVALLWPAWYQDIFTSNAGHGVKLSAYCLKRFGDLVIVRIGAHDRILCCACVTFSVEGSSHVHTFQVSHVDSKTDSNAGDVERMSVNKDEQEKLLIRAGKGNEGHQSSREGV
jgi:hypothetical protein